ncbi:Oidioi.mRNA.OKI2018_I69.XSR.g15203.t1.cds [Oikopleura dioica]|uniref:Oidioi.mRNA.OKI2018_I69.XSR.g15203.t1.cds n=1 Tax=Oikopleura dioica TaxID=34765 RepID=A0ABN7SG32_OIKDI|nr:Oidioi.mRNA.OKI2018_I69.XSR.g15203.t1.cds [Oikopleura dioica]
MKITKKLKKFEHIVWFALICLTGNATDLFLNQYPIVWARASWGNMKQLCEHVQGPAFQKSIREQGERILQFERLLETKMSKKYAPDEEEEARIAFKHDQQRLTSEQEHLDNAEGLDSRCQKMVVSFERLFVRRCEEYNHSNYFFVCLSIVGCFWCVAFLHSNPKPNFETFKSIKFTSATFCAILVATGNTWKFVYIIVLWVEAGDGLVAKVNPYQEEVEYGKHPAPEEIEVNCKLDYIRFNAYIHGVTAISSLMILSAFMYMLFKTAKIYSKNTDLEKAPKNSRKEEIEKIEHEKTVKEAKKASKTPKAGEKIVKQNDDKKNESGWNSGSNSQNDNNESTQNNSHDW